MPIVMLVLMLIVRPQVKMAAVLMSRVEVASRPSATAAVAAMAAARARRWVLLMRMWSLRFRQQR